VVVLGHHPQQHIKNWPSCGESIFSFKSSLTFVNSDSTKSEDPGVRPSPLMRIPLLPNSFNSGKPPTGFSRLRPPMPVVGPLQFPWQQKLHMLVVQAPMTL
jgi:hypothetical protein